MFALQANDHMHRITDLETQLGVYGVLSVHELGCEIEALKAQTGSLLLQLSASQELVAEERRNLAAAVSDKHKLATSKGRFPSRFTLFI